MSKVGESLAANYNSQKGSQKSESPEELWLCLRFTHLALNSMGIAFKSSNNPSIACAITYQQQIWQCNEAALNSLVKPGMGINHALMLTPELSLQERNLQTEAHKLQELSVWAYRFTSLVGGHNDHTLLLEIGRSIKLFNGLEHLINLINNDLLSFGMQSELGVAHTPKAAYILSFEASDCKNAPQEMRQHLQSNLKNASLSHLDIDPKIITQLRNCGLERLGDISNIPKAELGQRFGVTLLTYLDQLWGRLADPQIGMAPPETFQASADFAEPIRNLNWIDQQLERLLGDLAHFTITRQLICRSFTWRFYHENNRLLKTVTVGLSAKQTANHSQDKAQQAFKELTDLKLASIKLDWEFSSIELSSSQLIPVQLFNDDLFNPRPDQQQFNQLIDRLTNRLGHNALFRVHLEPEYLPELANGRQHAVQEVDPNSYFANEQNNSQSTYVLDEPLKDQPLWLLENPQRLAQQQRQPLFEGPLSIIHGPDRISSHWWAKLQSRDYFIARQRNGRLLWIFFDRSNRSWYLHGLFG